jgi:hypothetical protein
VSHSAGAPFRDRDRIVLNYSFLARAGGAYCADLTTNSSEPKTMKTMWPDRRLLNLFKTEFPIVLAPMAGAIDAD